MVNRSSHADGSGEIPEFDPVSVYSLSPDAFVDIDERIINIEYFKEYFDQVELPTKLAVSCLEKIFEIKPQRPVEDECVKFMRLADLRRADRIPMFQDVIDVLVDFRHIKGFTLRGAQSLTGVDDGFSSSPRIFVSHRWQSGDHPDPDGSQLDRILGHLSFASRRLAERAYLWIDFSCLPQRGDRGPLTPRLPR